MHHIIHVHTHTYTHTLAHTHRIMYRPSVISGFEGEMGQISEWWNKWRDFTFSTDVHTLDRLSPGAYKTQAVCMMIEPIRHTKYPAITVEEEAISIPLQTLALAIFDCVLVRMLQVGICLYEQYVYCLLHTLALPGFRLCACGDHGIYVCMYA